MKKIIDFYEEKRNLLNMIILMVVILGSFFPYYGRILFGYLVPAYLFLSLLFFIYKKRVPESIIFISLFALIIYFSIKNAYIVL
ncbi:hypothetical protein [Microaceticoccus formicicus]|uniref:hypothetical protein n=1 Tax=Microaceticoccus formicicus TaxID=3118105 RepID=UPI003CD02BAC|nr:hypothetical protein VZL98_07810 [Peptoniphilaceae bacterium AMB_02]